MIEQYLEKKNKYYINYYHFHKWSGMPFQEASAEWMKNLNKIRKFKKIK